MFRRALALSPALTLLLAAPGCYEGLHGAPDPTAGDDFGEDGGEDGAGGDDGAEGDDDGAGDDGAGDDGAGDDGGDPPAPFDPADPETYLRKVKLLLTGEPVSATELALVQADPDALRDLVRDWTETEAFRAKMLDFFQVAFQQEEITKSNIVSQIRGADANGNFDPRNELYRNLTESFARTAWNIVEQGRPFTEIATTRRWMMTTAVMSFLVAADDPPNSGPQHTFYNNNPPAGMSAGSSAAQQVANRAWYVPDGCVNPSYTTNRRYFVLPALMGRLDAADCPDFDGDAIMRDSDFSDWREVEIHTLGAEDDKVPYYDIPTLRDASTLGLEIPRTGFFSTPAFLAKWRSNVDNSYRVTTNQALIVALGQSFDDEDATMPLDDSGLSDDHADPATVCYGCHVQLDPMRNFFMKEFDADFYSALAEEPQDATPSFAFFGHVAEGDDLVDLGNAIATHPFFAGAWVQKMCFMANAQECDFGDPEFERIVQHFVDSGYDFRELVVELFSSPLVTGAERTMTHDTKEYLVSITRRAHLCHTLNLRLGMNNVCGGNNVANAVPEDAWSRGSSTPFQPAASSLFYAASLESFCDRTAKDIVDEEGSLLQSSDMEAATTFLVETLMDVSPEDSRYEMVRDAIEIHIEDARMLTNNDRIVLESAFTLACTSPFVTSVGM